MRILRFILAAFVPVSVVGIALLNASAVTSLVEATLGGGAPSARSAVLVQSPAALQVRSADAILDRNPFDHETSLRPPVPSEPSLMVADPAAAPLCEGVRPVVLVGDEDQSVAFAALDVGGKRVLRRRGGEVGDRTVAYVGRDRVWLAGHAGICQALLFGGAPPPPSVAASVKPSALEEDVAKHIVKKSEGYYSIDRPTLERIMEAQAEMMKMKAVPVRDASGAMSIQLLTVRPGSVLALMGLETSDRIATINGYSIGTPEGALEAYARLRLADRLVLSLERAGKPVTLDYSIQ